MFAYRSLYKRRYSWVEIEKIVIIYITMNSFNWILSILTFYGNQIISHRYQINYMMNLKRNDQITDKIELVNQKHDE